MTGIKYPCLWLRNARKHAVVYECDECSNFTLFLQFCSTTEFVLIHMYIYIIILLNHLHCMFIFIIFILFFFAINNLLQNGFCRQLARALSCSNQPQAACVYIFVNVNFKSFVCLSIATFLMTFLKIL